MSLDRQIESLKDVLACQTAHLDQIQMRINTYRQRLSEDDVRKIQVEIDRHRFHIEQERRKINELTSL